MRLKREFFTATLCFTINSCASAPSYPELYNSEFSYPDMETVTAASKTDVLNRLHESRELWEAREPSHYQYIIGDSTYFVCGIFCGPNEVEVKDGEVVKVTYRGKRQSGYSNGDVLLEDDWQKFSFDAHFLRAESFLNNVEDLVGKDWGDERFWFYIEYDPKYGNPKRISRNDPRDFHGGHDAYIGYFKIIE